MYVQRRKRQGTRPYYVLQSLSLLHILEVSVINDPPEITGESRILSKVLLHCLPTALNKLVHFPRWAENIVRGNAGLSRIQALAPDYALGGHHYVGVFNNDGWAVGMEEKERDKITIRARNKQLLIKLKQKL